MIKKHNLYIKTILLATVLISVLSSFHKFKDEPKRKVKIIVIDPGHGGKDPGCNGVKCKEKDVALAVALKFGKLIEDKIKDVKVVFTRKTDVFVELEDRAKIANDNNADLFISIHCNAAGKPVMIKDKKTGKMRPKTFKNSKGKIIVLETSNPKPYGSETYVMGLKNEEGKMKVAQRENAAMLLEDNYETKYQGFDPNSEESYIIMSNYTSSYVLQSASLALGIQEQYSKKAGRVDKGVHRQSIWVLWRTSMPSVLTEIGYLTNPEEEKFLGSEKGQDYLASCLFRAFRKYKDDQEGIKKNYNDEIENHVPADNERFNLNNESENDANDDVVESDEVENSDTVKVTTEKINTINDEKNKQLTLLKKAKEDSVVQSKLNQEKVKENEKKYKQIIALADINFKNKKYNEAQKLYLTAEDLIPNNSTHLKNRLSEIETILGKENSNQGLTNSLKEGNISSIYFGVQFANLDKEVDAIKEFSNLKDVAYYKTGNQFKYYAGKFNTIEEAGKEQANLKLLGYKDCFIVAFKDGIRINIEEARKLIK
jgi:N-acetylmuramoyl-L-alanine amidase